MLIIDKAKWYAGADVVVVGYGAAGAVAAITAHDAGADVLILERQPSQRHVSNSYMSGGAIISPPDAAVFEKYLQSLCRVDANMAWTESDIIKVWAEYTCQNAQWLKKMGAVLNGPSSGGGHREIAGNDQIQYYQFPENGVGLMKLLKKLVEDRKIRVQHGVRAGKLLTNVSGEVIGVGATGDKGVSINIRAARAVILASGGFEFDETMKLQFLRCYPMYFDSSPANTGDGVRMAMGVGADLWHMNCAAAGCVMKFPEMPYGFFAAMRGKDRGLESWAGSSAKAAPTCGYIMVDKSGRRFTNENFKIHHLNLELALYDTRAMQYPRIPSFWIMDQKRVSDGPLATVHSGSAGRAGFYRWSDDNRPEVEKGWIVRGETVKDLAGKLGLDPVNLQSTVESYNRYCAGRADPDFRRRPESLVPLDNPPYYAVKLWPGGPNTQGGPRRNRKSQVMSVEGSPVPGLYAAGELGSMFGMLYTGGGNLAECIAFGRVAGENASREKPRV